MKNYNIMIKPASGLCNMRCAYCFYADEMHLRGEGSRGMMTRDTAVRLLDNVFADLHGGDRVNFVFQGGEPLLVGKEFLEHFTDEARRRARGVDLSFALQTNATLIDDGLCDFFRENSYLIGISLDGMKETHDRYRTDAEGSGTHRTVMEAMHLLESHGVEYNVLMTLTPALAKHPQKVWKFILDNSLAYVQFTPCLGGLEGSGDAFALTPELFARFYRVLFRLWFEELKKGRQISVKLFDDIVNLLARGEVNACGLTGICSSQIVVEADGSVYPCDFYMLDGYRLGNLRDSTVPQLLNSPARAAFETRPRNIPLCSACRYRRMCGGGCPRMKESVYYGEGSVFCGYRDFLDATIEDFKDIAATVLPR